MVKRRSSSRCGKTASGKQRKVRVAKTGTRKGDRYVIRRSSSGKAYRRFCRK